MYLSGTWMISGNKPRRTSNSRKSSISLLNCQKIEDVKFPFVKENYICK